MMRLTICLALLLAIAATDASAQRYDVSGSVADTLGVPLPGATVVLLQRTDSSIVSFAASDPEGAFRIRRAPQGSYLLQITFVGFATHTDSVDVTNSPVDLGEIRLRVEDQALGDLVISADRTPLVLRGDTLDFSAAAFMPPPGSSVEDLLRRLPGVEVDREGNIKAQGEDVQKVLVDGKEFFGSDPTIATRNLPSDAVDRVQVYDKESDAAEFTGVADGNEARTINLSLKPDRRVGGFGKVSGAVGGASSAGDALGEGMRYDTDASINRFWGSTRLSILAGANNVNGSAYGPSQFPELAALARGGRAVFIGGAPDFGGGASDGFVSSLSGGVNLSREAGKTEFDGSYYASYKDSERDRRTLQQRLLGEGRSADLDVTSDQSSDAYAHTLNLDVEHEFADGHDLRFRSEGYYGTSDGRISELRQTDSPSNDTQNTRDALTTSDGDEWRGEGSLTYRRRFEGDRSVVATIRGNRTDAGSLENVGSRDRFFTRDTLLTVTEIARLEDEQTTTSGASLRLLGTQPLGGGRALQLDGSLGRNANARDRRVDDIVGGATAANARLSSDFEQTIDQATAGLTYRDNGKGRREDRSFNLGVDVQTTWLRGETVGIGGAVDRRFVQVLPSVRYDQPLGTGRRMSFRYNTSTQEPSVRQLQPLPDDRDPLNVYVGNPDLRPSYQHALSAQYFHFDSFAFTNLFAFVRASYTPTAISTSRVVDARFRQETKPVNVGGEWNVSGNLNHGRPIRPLGVKVSLSGQASYRRATELLNGDQNRSDLTRTSLDLRVENRRKTVFDVQVGARYAYNTSAYQLSPQFDRNYLSRTFYTEASIEMGRGWRMESSLDFELYPDDVFGDAQQVPLWNAQLSYDATRKIRVELGARDLLNQGLGVSYSDTGSFVQEERVSSLGRYVLLKLSYDLGAGVGGSGAPPPPPGR